MKRNLKVDDVSINASISCIESFCPIPNPNMNFIDNYTLYNQAPGPHSIKHFLLPTSKKSGETDFQIKTTN